VLMTKCRNQRRRIIAGNVQCRFCARQRWRFDWRSVDWHNGGYDRWRGRNRKRIIGRMPIVWIEYDANVLLDRMRGRGEHYQYDGCTDRSHSTPAT
jgi:hypothetical protein